jgi:SagB-type dehydrogenase family enzyme
MSNQELKKPFISSLVEGCVDSAVQQDLLKSFAKESITFLEFGNLSITNVNPLVINRVEFTECEISPFHTHDINCTADKNSDFVRASSFSHFAPTPIDFSILQNFLIHTFSPDQKGHRPYPSAGGLYPLEPIIFIFPERVQNLPSMIPGAYHFRALSRQLQLIKKMSVHYFFQELLHDIISPDHRPCFAILYIAHLGKAIFKYRYRGYRQAMMEAGSMYQHATYVSQNIGLRSTVWSTFSEPELLFALDLDHATFLPLTMQLFGYE